jgi:hypothetical protein
MPFAKRRRQQMTNCLVEKKVKLRRYTKKHRLLMSSKAKKETKISNLSFLHLKGTTDVEHKIGAKSL